MERKVQQNGRPQGINNLGPKLKKYGGNNAEFGPNKSHQNAL